MNTQSLNGIWKRRIGMCEEHSQDVPYCEYEYEFEITDEITRGKNTLSVELNSLNKGYNVLIYGIFA